MPRLVAWLRLVHPFPSALDAAVTALLAYAAGAQTDLVARLAAAMLVLQFSIGASNDVADEQADRVRLAARGSLSGTTPPPSRVRRSWTAYAKPVARGLISRRAATSVAAAFAIAGLAVAGSVRPAALVLAAAGLCLGLWYNLRAKGTVWSWLPFAAGIGLLPLYAWVGATGRLPPALLGIAPLAVVAGATLALSNAIGDLDVDTLAGVESIATRLGPAVSLVAAAATLAVLQAVVAATLVLVGAAALPLAAAAGGGAVGWIGLAFAARPPSFARQLGWELQAVGIAVIGVAWIGALVEAGVLRA